MNKYYVYFHKNPLTNEVFYVGKGCGRRAYVNDNRGKHYLNYVNKYGNPIIEIVKDNISNEEAVELEKKLINELGRSELQNGNLVNSTDGGETGVSGMVHTIDAKLKMSESKKGKPSNSKGKKWSDISREKKRISMLGSKRGTYKERKDKGKTFDSEIKQRMREGRRDKTKEVLQFDLQNNLIREWRSAPDAIDSTGLCGIYNCLIGISKQSGKFIWKYRE